ncbi:MAG: UDP-glucose 4-epimerase [Candidatus Pelagibacter sp.]|nr:UDP-glucose 4-epimerase [Candidatus Pelagibacter sp.]|tara:strand:+ start:1391 stop:2380 length:990 start_codon:yes stop_codon:yes gene_type:complete
MNSSQKIFITGGAGYVGCVLTEALLRLGHSVTVLDLMIYGENLLEESENLKLIRGDIRDKALLQKHLPGHDILIHLACISNDPSFELDSNLGKSINYEAFTPLVVLSKDLGIKRFIYASSSSVYGIKQEPSVTEEMSLEPLTEYSKYKAMCEDVLEKYNDEGFTTVTIRPATVCGVSRRQRLDVIVNIFTNLAYNRREISVYGGRQYRPNIHIDDMVDAYITLIDASSHLINNQKFNVGYKNQTVLELANIVRDVVGKDVSLKTTKSDDNRSYHISSKKIDVILNFKAKRSIKDAVKDLTKSFENHILIDPLNNELYFNIKRMQSINLD